MKDEVIKLNKKELFNTLKNWETYTFILFKKLAKEMPTSFEMDSYHQQYVLAPFAEEIKLSDLSELLWKSLQSGAGEVDVIHDEAFVNEQIEYFKNRFSDAESIPQNISICSGERHQYYEPNEPMTSFMKMGKPAQLKIIQEGLLEVAKANFEQAEQILEKKYREEQIRHQEWYEKNHISLQLKKEVRAKDNEQCVFCGRAYHYHSFDYLKTNDEKPELENVLLACNGCLSKRKKHRIEPAFGRFSTEQS